jgi:hypothetical protein
LSGDNKDTNLKVSKTPPTPHSTRHLKPNNTQTNNKQQTTNNKQQTTNNKQQTTNNKQQTTIIPKTKKGDNKLRT